MSKHKWQPPQIARTPEPEVLHIKVHQYGEPGEPTPATVGPRYKAECKSFSGRMQDGVNIPWHIAMERYLNDFARDTGASLHSSHPTYSPSDILFIWEMPCP